MESKFDQDQQENFKKTDMAEAGTHALDDAALDAAAGGGIYIPSTNQRCHYCGRTGVSLTQKTITPWRGNVYGYGKPYQVWVCANCLASNQGSAYQKPFV